MEIGKIAVIIGLIAAIASVTLYLLANRGSRGILYAARAAFAVTGVSAILCFGRLMWLVTHKQFQYDYVYHYVSPDLGYPFLAAATWAGQEGSFLLWALWTAVIGGLIAWKAGKWESRVMPFYVLGLCFLFAILTWQSPYNPTVKPLEYPPDLPWPPTFGMGLNPSLQNYWMAIHPPTIFFGFASLAVPFAYAIAAMIWREYDSWATRVMPWVLMTIATLGVGLFMGGYWAYETQGWHGFWAWDPVENASLFPWLGGLGLLHGLVVQKSRGGMGRTTLFLAILCWPLFLWGTFLTRSGVLANASVHAFDMIEKSALKLIIWMIAIYGLGGLGLLIWRWRSIPGRPISDKALSRDTAMVLAVTLMITTCVIVLIGSSWPLISRWDLIKHIPGLSYSPKGIAVQPAFYNKVGTALVIPTLILMGAVPFLAWGKTNADKFLWKVLTPWFLAIGIGVCVLAFVWSQAGSGFHPSLTGYPVLVPNGKTDDVTWNGQPASDVPGTVVVAIATLGAFALFANIGLAWRVLRSKAVTMGGWLAHVGIGTLMLGTVLTNTYEHTVTGDLLEGDKPLKTPFGYSIQFVKFTHDGKSQEEVRKEWWEFGHGVVVRVIPDSNEAGVAHADSPATASADGPPGSFLAILPVFHNQQMVMNAKPGDPTTMKWPYIGKGWTRDIYLLVADDPKLERIRLTVRPGDTGQIPTTKYTVHYKRFYMSGPPGTPGTTMGAEMELTTPDGRKIAIRPGKKFAHGGDMVNANVEIPEVQGGVILEGGVDPATKQVTVAFELPEAPAVWRVPIAVTNKPWINLVWGGVILMGLGTLCAMLRRSLEARKGNLILAAAAAGAADVQASISAGHTGNGHDQAVTGAGKVKVKSGRAKAARKR